MPRPLFGIEIFVVFVVDTLIIPRAKFISIIYHYTITP